MQGQEFLLQLQKLQNLQFAHPRSSLPEEGGRSLRSTPEGTSSLLESSEDNLENKDALPLPPEFEYLYHEVNDCRLYLQKRTPKFVEGPVDDLFLGPLPNGKSHTLVLGLNGTLVYSYSYKDGVPMLKHGSPPKREPDVTLTLNADEALYRHDVWYRPGLRDFLAAVSRHYEILVFSGGTKAYVENVIRGHVDPHEEFIGRILTRDDLSRYDARKGKRRGKIEFGGLTSIKDISAFFSGPHARQQKQVVCVDSRVSNFVNNLRNVAPIRLFKGDADDVELSELYWFLRALTEEADVREGIRKRCDLLAHVGSQSRYHTPTSSDDEDDEFNAGGGDNVFDEEDIPTLTPVKFYQ